MRLHELRQHLVNVLAVAAATLGWVFMTAWFHSRESDLLGPEVSGVFLVWVLPLLVECLAAVGAGAALAHLLRTERPVVYGILLGSTHILYRWMMMTIGEPGWQGAVLIATDLLLPAVVAAMATAWLYRRREARTLPAA